MLLLLDTKVVFVFVATMNGSKPCLRAFQESQACTKDTCIHEVEDPKTDDSTMTATVVIPLLVLVLLFVVVMAVMVLLHLKRRQCEIKLKPSMGERNR